MRTRLNGTGIFRTAVVILTVLILMCTNFACAVDMEEYGAKYKTDDVSSMIDVDIINFKVRLKDLGFYIAGIDDATLQTRALDDLTMAAVKLVCELNPDLVFYDDGVSNMLYWRVMGMVDGELKTPLGEEYHMLSLGDTGDEVTNVQNRLNQLGYDAVGRVYTPGVYDDELQIVIDEFVRCNKFIYDADGGITSEMQKLMYGDEAVPYTAEEIPEVKTSVSEKVFGYFGAKSVIFGLRIPNIVLLIVGFLLLCAIVVMVLKLFFPGIKDGKTGKNVHTIPGEVEFKIEYGNNCIVHRTNVAKKCVRIGRATGDFPLNMEDETISRKHCEIYCENGKLMLTDFSSYGTIINGSKCHHSQQALSSGDMLEIGKHRITISY